MPVFEGRVSRPASRSSLDDFEGAVTAPADKRVDHQVRPVLGDLLDVGGVAPGAEDPLSVLVLA